MRKIVLAALLLLPMAAHAEAVDKATPDELAPQLRLAESDGAAIYRLDHAASIATDAMRKLDVFQHEKRVAGWLTQDKGSAVLVTFFGGASGDPPQALYRVTVADSGALVGEPAVLAPAAPLSASEVAQAAARSLALHSDFAPCSKNYNTVTVPRNKGDITTWSVYLLAGTTVQGTLPAGGNYRVDTDGAGKSILSSRGFTKSCITLSNDKSTAALMISHLMDPTPTEIHVFLNLLSGKPMYVLTTDNSYMWSVENGKISFSSRITPKH